MHGYGPGSMEFVQFYRICWQFYTEYGPGKLEMDGSTVYFDILTQLWSWMHEISQFIEYVDNYAWYVVLEDLKMHGSIVYFDILTWLWSWKLGISQIYCSSIGTLL